MKSKRSLLPFPLKALVSLALLVFLFSQIDVSGLLHALVSAHLPYVAVVLVAYLLSQLVSCLRWQVLARPLDFKLSFIKLLSFYFIGMFFNLFAPSTVGGDIGRVFYLSRSGVENKQGGATTYALISVVADRAIGLAVLVWIGAVALALFPTYSLAPIIPVVTYLIALGFLLGWLSVPLIRRLLRYTGRPSLENLCLGLDVYWSRQSVILQAVLLSLV
ncbi:MAG: lysylphosphatidylglycerol synthase transmembrane domain-containing protein, partial [Candidatus Binatia bacterium]